MVATDLRRADRRARLARLRYPERRTGFDPRRRSPLLEYLRDNRGVLIALLLALNLFSLADWVLTIAALGGGAVEGNPLLAALMGRSLVLAGVFKVAVMLGVSLLVWRGRAFRAVLATVVVGVGLYFAVLVYHVAGLAAIGAI